MENKIAILESRIEQLESEKAEMIKAIELALSKSTKDGWLYRIFENVIKKHGVNI